MLSNLIHNYKNGNLILQIFIGIITGVLLGAFVPKFVPYISILGDLFIGALKAIAPILVFILIATSLCTKDFSQSNHKMKNVIFLYIIGTFLASVSAVIISFVFPVELVLSGVEKASNSSPESIDMVFKDLLFKIVDNPINALANGNYIGILTWAIAFGMAMKHCSAHAKELFVDINHGVLKIVNFIVKLAPFGIFALVAHSIASTGSAGLNSYLKLLVVLVLTMFFVAFIINALIVFIVTKKNPYPLIFICLKRSAVFAFFTRSSAANIPVNMALCEKLGVDKDLYGVSIPIGATINMAGAAVTIAVLSLAAAHTLGIHVSFFEAILLSIIATFAACGASGVAGGSLLLIPFGLLFVQY